MKTKEIKSKTVKTKPVVKKNIIESDILPEPTIRIEENNINNSNNRTLEYKLNSGRIFAAPCTDELFSTLSRRAKLEYLDFCCRNDLKLSEIQDNFY